jgi:type VI secretion system secreted protein VgrG
MDMPVITQTKRPVRLTTPFGGDTLLLGQMSAVESLSQLFQYDLVLVSEKGDLNPDTILGKPVTITMLGGERMKERFFHGLVTEFAQAGYDERLHEYRAVVRPWFWFLTRTADCRVFQNKSVPDIFQEVCRQAGFADFRVSLTGSYDPWEYCVQYRETDFQFLSRLLEREGIFYFFEHSSDKHVLVLSDDAGQLKTVSGYDSVPFFPPAAPGTQRERDHLSAWEFHKAFHPGSYATREFDFKTPTPVLAGTASITRQHEAAKFEIFDYPAATTQQNSAALERIAKVRVQELQASQMQARGSGDAQGLTTGKLFKLTGHPRSDLNIQYVVTSTTIELLNDDFKTGGGGDQQFTISIEAVDAREAYRPARKTPKPIVQGTQTAIVVGPKGEEIYTDEFSRVKVQFHWDRYGKLDENSSCWVRVAQAWAGKAWGGIQIPRIGQEVVVSFLEGDPDRPLVIGSVYNGSNKPPYALPDNKTQSGFKSRSSMTGAADNFNEIRFEDKKGAEQVYIQAEKNQDILVKNDETHSVGNDRKKDVKHDETTSIGNDRTETVGNNEKITIAKDRTIDVNGEEKASVVMDRTHSVGQNEKIDIGQKQAITIGRDQDVKIGAAQSVDIARDQTLNIGKNQSIDVGSNQNTNVGKGVVIDAGDSITFRTGAASITLKSDGTIQIRGRNITVDGGGKLDVSAAKNMILKAAKILQN